VGDDDQARWLNQRILRLLRTCGDGAQGTLATSRIEALLSLADQAQWGREQAYCELARELITRVAQGSPVLELLRDSLEPPLEAEEIHHIAGLISQTPAEGSSPAEAAPHTDPAGSAEPDPLPVDDDEGSTRTLCDPDHRANSLFKEHLDHQRRDIEALRSRLCADAEETIRANQEAGRLLESLITRLQLGTTVPEVLDAQLEMAEEIQRVAEAHDTVAQKLSETFESLQSLAVDNERLQEELQRVRVLSLTDESTDLPNRRAFLRQLRAEAARVQREAGTFSVAVLDLDHFKAVNDRYGHGAGDEVLRVYAREVLSVFRAHDLVARYGGEEFAILLPSTGVADAVRAIAKIQRVARSVIVRWDGLELGLPTFSAGVAEYSPDEGPDELIHRADRALYRAKTKGRDRIEPDGLNMDEPLAGPHLVRGGDDELRGWEQGGGS